MKRKSLYRPRRKAKTNAPKGCASYRALYDLVDGAVRNVFIYHPEYFAKDADPKAVQQSIAKRAAGELVRRENRIRSFLRKQEEPAPVKSGG